MKSGRNDPCPCGSGRKYKKCCLRGDEDLVHQIPAVRQAEAIGHVDSAAPAAESTGGEDSNDRDDSSLPPEARGRLDALWKEFDAVSQSTAAQMDEFLGELLALQPEATS